MLAFKKAPSPAFNAAVARLSELRSFSVAIEQEADRLSGEVITQRFTEIIGPSRYKSWHQYRASETAIGYLKPDHFCNSESYKPSGSLLREKFFSDILQDLRLPHAPAALMATNPQRPDVPNALISLVAYENAKSIDEVCTGGRCSLMMVDRHYPVFLQENPELAPAFAALSVADIWMRNYDRHSGSIVLGARGAQGRYTQMYGVDLDKVNFYIDPPDRIPTALDQDQRWALFTLPPDKIAPYVEAAVTAIEHYPQSRMQQLAARLQPYAQWTQNFTTDIERLTLRQQQLRRVLPEYFDPKALTHPAP